MLQPFRPQTVMIPDHRSTRGATTPLQLDEGTSPRKDGDVRARLEVDPRCGHVHLSGLGIVRCTSHYSTNYLRATGWIQALPLDQDWI